MAGGLKIAAHFENEGLHFTAWRTGDGSRVAGKQALHQRLHFERGKDGSVTQWPGLVILDGAAPHLCRTLPALEYSKQRPELWDKTAEDHAADSVTGFCKMRPWAPTKPDDKKGWRERLVESDDDDWMTA